MNRPEYKLTIRPLQDKSDPAGIRRLRRAIKCLLRSFGLRVTDIRELRSETSEGGKE
jgi:hypothetical protein